MNERLVLTAAAVAAVAPITTVSLVGILAILAMMTRYAILLRRDGSAQEAASD